MSAASLKDSVGMGAMTREQILELIAISGLNHYAHCQCNHLACSNVVLAQLLDEDDPVYRTYMGGKHE